MPHILFDVRLSALAVGLALVPWTGSTSAQDRATARSMVISRTGIVATSHVQASRAGARVLELGGSAVDAAIAANATLAVTEPMTNGMGGDLFALYWDAATGRLYGLNSSGWAPKGLTVQHLAARGLDRMPQAGIDSVTVPGAVAGWAALHERFGRLEWKALFDSAIHYAEDGYPVPEIIHDYWAESVDRLAEDPASQRLFLPGGRAPAVGQIFRNPAMAAALRLVASLLSKGYAKDRARLIDPARANCTVAAGTPSGSDTTYLTAIDRQGNIVSLIQSVYSSFGSGITVDGMGFVLQNRGGLFSLNPSSPNVLRPRKRPFHTIIPGFMEKGDRQIGFGIMGGPNQPLAHAQFVSNVVDYGMNIQEALEEARFTGRRRRRDPGTLSRRLPPGRGDLVHRLAERGDPVDVSVLVQVGH